MSSEEMSFEIVDDDRQMDGQQMPPYTISTYEPSAAKYHLIRNNKRDSAETLWKCL